jgi:hypothetical protein
MPVHGTATATPHYLPSSGSQYTYHALNCLIRVARSFPLQGSACVIFKRRNNVVNMMSLATAALD